MIPELRTILAGLLVAAGAAVPAPADDPPREELDAYRQAVLDIAEGRGDWAGATRAEARAALARLGPGCARACVEHLMGLLAAEEPEPGEAVDPRWDAAELVHEALGRFPVRSVEDAVARVVADERTDLEGRRVAAGLVGERGDADSLPLLVSIYEEIEEVHLLRPYVRAPFADALRGILDRDDEGLEVLALRARTLTVPVALAVTDAIDGRGSADALRVLERLLARDPQLDEEVLGLLARLVPETPDVCDRACELARGFLEDPDARLERAAALAVGNLADAESAETLVRMLRADDERTRGTALRALQALARVRWTGEPERWEGWLAIETAWYVDDFHRLERELDHGGDAEALEALRELASHPLWRRAAARVLGELALRTDGNRAVQAVSSLAALDDPDARFWLTRLVDHPDGDVRDAARSTLGVAADILPH